MTFQGLFFQLASQILILLIFSRGGIEIFINLLRIATAPQLMLVLFTLTDCIPSIMHKPLGLSIRHWMIWRCTDMLKSTHLKELWKVTLNKLQSISCRILNISSTSLEFSSLSCSTTSCVPSYPACLLVVSPQGPRGWNYIGEMMRSHISHLKMRVIPKCSLEWDLYTTRIPQCLICTTQPTVIIIIMHGCIHESLIISCNRYGYTCAVNIDTTESSRGANACSGPFFFACSFKLLLPEDILERILRQTFKNTDPFDDVIMFITSLFIRSNATPPSILKLLLYFFFLQSVKLLRY